MSMKQLKLASNAVLELVPDLVVGVSQFGKAFGNTAESLALFTDDNLKDQKLLQGLKSDYRDVVAKESKDAAAKGDKASILQAYKDAKVSFEEFDS